MLYKELVMTRYENLQELLIDIYNCITKVCKYQAIF